METVSITPSNDWDVFYSYFSKNLPRSLKLASTFKTMSKVPGITKGGDHPMKLDRDAKTGVAILRESNDSVGSVTNTVFCPLANDKEEADEKILEQLKAFLDSTLDWNERQVFGDVQPHLEPMIKSLCSRGCGCKGGKMEWETPCHVFISNQDKLPELDLEEDGITVGPVQKDEHVKMVIENWEFKLDDTLDRMKVMFENELCYGTFDKGKLVSWICTMRYGGMGILYTPEQHRRRGHARKCIIGLSRKLISLGLTPFVYIEDHNSSSRKLFESLGFEMSHRASWIGYVPNKLSKDGGKKGCCH